MSNYIKRFLSKSEEENEVEISLPKTENATFALKIDHLVVATQHYENGEWQFKYTEELKELRNKYNHIAGFSNLDKVY